MNERTLSYLSNTSGKGNNDSAIKGQKFHLLLELIHFLERIVMVPLVDLG